MNKENYGLSDEQLLKLKQFVTEAKSLQDDIDEIIPATSGEVEAIEIAFQLQARIDKALLILDHNPGVLSTLIRDILTVGD